MTVNIDLINRIKSFDDENKPDDYKDYVSVSKVLDTTSDKSGLIAWRNKVGKEEADRITLESTTIGNYLDNAVEKYLMGESFEINPEHHFLFEQLQPTLDEMQLIRTQMRLWSNTLKVKGRLDAVVVWNDEIVLVDIKQSRKLKKIQYLENYFHQCAFYSIMIHELTGVPIRKIAILLGNRSVDYPTIEVKHMKDYIPKIRSKIAEYRSFKELENL